ncbi:MAG: hypothetical protein GOV02_02730 [Candidatus Aenigmarchaeota archaeon]|nr:hypothetical protein [Candidatus Aenigmarchaeota archaeon]
MKQKLIHSPTLNTVMMVEKALQNAEDSIVTVADLKRMLPRQVNHRTLMAILQYLEYSNKIAVSIKGITWIHNPKLHAMIREGIEM